MTDIKMLALAVLSGDNDAAAALADEVIAQYSPSACVLRSEVLRRIAALESAFAQQASNHYMVGQRCYINGDGILGATIRKVNAMATGVVIAVLPYGKVAVMNETGMVGIYHSYEISTFGPI